MSFHIHQFIIIVRYQFIEWMAYCPSSVRIGHVVIVPFQFNPPATGADSELPRRHTWLMQDFRKWQSILMLTVNEHIQRSRQVMLFVDLEHPYGQRLLRICQYGTKPFISDCVCVWEQISSITPVDRVWNVIVYTICVCSRVNIGHWPNRINTVRGRQ